MGRKKREKKKDGQEWMYQRASPKLTSEVLRTIKRKYKHRNPPTFRHVSTQMNLSVGTVHNAVKKRLRLKRRKKTKVLLLTARDRKNRKINSRKFYEKFLSGKKSMFVVTLDEANVHVRQKGSQRNHYYIGEDEEVDENEAIPCNENFPAQFMIVGAMCETKTFPLIKVPKNTKINAQYYVEYVLEPLIEEHLKPYFKDDINKVVLHHDKASSHTARVTTDFLKSMEAKYGIRYLEKAEIPVKGADISPMDFYGFSFIKQLVGKSRATTEDGVWKKCCAAWDNVSSSDCHKVFQAWKRRCRKVHKEDGGPVEQFKNIHSHKIKL